MATMNQVEEIQCAQGEVLRRVVEWHEIEGAKIYDSIRYFLDDEEITEAESRMLMPTVSQLIVDGEWVSAVRGGGPVKFVGGGVLPKGSPFVTVVSHLLGCTEPCTCGAWDRSTQPPPPAA